MWPCRQPGSTHNRPFDGYRSINVKGATSRLGVGLAWKRIRADTIPALLGRAGAFRREHRGSWMPESVRLDG